MSTTKPKNPPAKGGLSLYANLLDPPSSSSSGTADNSTISRAPVVFQQPGASSISSTQDDAATAAKKQISAAALRFQPSRRPQVATQKAKTKAAGFARPTSVAAAAAAAATVAGGGSGVGNTTTTEADAYVASSNATHGKTGPSAVDQSQPQPPAPKATLADWTANDNDDEENVNSFHQGEKRQRGGRKKRKKGNKGGEAAQIVQDWDDIYDPTRPNNYEEYVNSDEKRREIREWKEKLYAHRRTRRRDSLSSSEGEGEQRGRPAKAFAPPANYSFAPPPTEESAEKAPSLGSEPTTRDVPHDATGEVAYLRRLQLSNAAPPQPETHGSREQPLPPSLPLESSLPSISAIIAAAPSPPPPPPPPPPPSDTPPQYPQPQEPRPPAPSTTSTPVAAAAAAAAATATISRAPVRYNLPAAPAEIQVSQDDLDASLARDSSHATEDANANANANATTHQDNPEQQNQNQNQEQQQQQQQQQQTESPAPRSNRPGQAGFAQRYMASQGWKRGEGLGASGSGIINPLRVQVEKRKQRSDAEGGGFVGPGGKGRIVGGAKKKRKTKEEGGGGDGEEDKEEEEEEHGKFGPMSEVVIAKGMLTGMDVDVEIGNGLLQELGEECEAKYGRLVRVFINRESSEVSPPVFFHFTTALSALRAVNALHGRIFNGNTIIARFFDAEKFEKDVFE